MKKTVSLFLILMLLLGGLTTAAAEGQARVFNLEFPIFCCEVESVLNHDWPLYFMDGVEDVPWIDLEELADVMNDLLHDVYERPSFQLTYSQEGSQFTLKRENGFWMKVNYKDNTITFNDYNAFVQKPGNETLLDLLAFSGFNEAGEAELFQRDAKASYDRFGDLMTLDLTDYDIHLVMDGDRGYIPLQTANDFVVSRVTNRSLLYNGMALFFANADDMYDREAQDVNDLGKLYFAAEPAKRSTALADFGYKELCMMLDSQYGLKKKHNVDYFAHLFWEIGFDEELTAASSENADYALHSFINFYLDDLHSAYGYSSWMTGLGMPYEEGNGPSNRLYDNQEDQYKAIRSKLLGDKVEAYQEVGNTAYITFDEFASKYKTAYYYKAASEGTRVEDTIGLIVYASQQINRENSPIENVVIDLSINGGGDADAALFVISWILGEAEVSVEDSFTGAQSTMVYRADVNLDRQFDEKDTLKGKHVYCLISPLSFSCGNLVPAVCKANQAVTLIGRTSGGGACVVQTMSTAWGTTFQISGNSRLSFRKNGSFYDIDEGIAPDVYISRLETLYDREKLNDLINNLP